MPRILWVLSTLLLAVGLFAPGVPSALAGEGVRPKIGLALSGGGARGAAHVGVLRVLEENLVPIDYIAGTSMGSIVGGLYASGMGVDDIERALAEIPWEDVFKDRPPRAERRYRRKQDDYSFLIEHRIGVKETEREVNIAPALIQGQKFDLVLRKYLLPVAGVGQFDRLRIPFRAVATDIVTGKAAVLDSGDLPTAIRASMAVPAAFAPVELDDRLLVDGGISMNLPISVVRDMGADIVIAVDISTPGLQKEEIRSALDMLNQLSALLTRRDTEAQIASLSGHDLLIVPALGDAVTSADFKPEKLREAVAIGEAGAQAKLPGLRRLALREAAYASYRARTEPAAATTTLIIDYVRVENQSQLSDEVIRARVGVNPGELLDPTKIDAAIGRIYDQDNFESVRYRVEKKDGKTGVIITAKEKSWGTSSLQLGLDLASVSSDDSRFNLGAAYTMMPLNDLNGEWRTLFRVGEESLLYTEIYQPLDPGEKWFFGIGGGYESRKFKVYDTLGQSQPSIEYDIRSVRLDASAGRNLADWGRVALRYHRALGSADAFTGGTSQDDFDFDDGNLELRLSADTLDNLAFPSSGMRGYIYGGLSRKVLGADSDFEQFGASILAAGNQGRHRYNALAYFETTPHDDAPVQDYFRLGGFAKLSGFNEGQLAGQHAALLRATYFYDLGTDVVSTYAGGTLEAGNVWQDSGDVDMNDLLYAGSLFIGLDTLLGPLYLAYGHAEGGNNGIYLYLGKPWFRF